MMTNFSQGYKKPKKFIATQGWLLTKCAPLPYEVVTSYLKAYSHTRDMVKLTCVCVCVCVCLFQL